MCQECQCDCNDCDDAERGKVIDNGIDGVKQYLRDNGFPESNEDTVLILIQAAMEEAKGIMTPLEFMSGIYNLLDCHTKDAGLV